MAATQTTAQTTPQPTESTTNQNTTNATNTANENGVTYASASLYIGDLSPSVSEERLFEIFQTVGPVSSVRICRDAETRKSLGYGYINFHSSDDAERALDTMNFTKIDTVPCRIMWSNRDPTLRRSGVGNIFVKNLDKSLDNKSLYDTFSMFGNILSCKVATNSKDESLGYGFVHYDNEEAAQAAIKNVNGMSVNGKKLFVSKFVAREERDTTGTNIFTNVFVKNLPESYSDADVEKLFSQFGKITSTYRATDKEDNFKGFAFVNYETPDSASKAVDELNNKEIDGKELFVGRAQKKDVRERELREKFLKLKVERQKKLEGCNLYIKNLAEDVDDEKLQKMFSIHGSITSARVQVDKKSGKSRGFGFVCFSAPEEATKAVSEMNGKMVDGKPLYVSLFQNKDVRRQQLRNQFTQRAKMGINQPMGYQGPYQMGFPNQVVRGFGYPQMMQRRYPPQVMGRYPMGNYMPVMNQMNRRPRGFKGPRRGPRQMHQQNFKYTQNVRNNRQQQQQAQQQQQQQQQQQVQQQQQQTPQDPNNNQNQNNNTPQNNVANQNSKPSEQTPLTLQALTAASESQQKQMIGERLFPLIQEHEAENAGKITGMLLEMDNGELLNLLESKDALKEKVDEAVAVLHMHKVEPKSE